MGGVTASQEILSIAALGENFLLRQTVQTQPFLFQTKVWGTTSLAPSLAGTVDLTLLSLPYSSLEHGHSANILADAYKMEVMLRNVVS